MSISTTTAIVLDLTSVIAEGDLLLINNEYQRTAGAVSIILDDGVNKKSVAISPELEELPVSYKIVKDYNNLTVGTYYQKPSDQSLLKIDGVFNYTKSKTAKGYKISDITVFEDLLNPNQNLNGNYWIGRFENGDIRYESNKPIFGTYTGENLDYLLFDVQTGIWYDESGSIGSISFLPFSVNYVDDIPQHINPVELAERNFSTISVDKIIWNNDGISYEDEDAIGANPEAIIYPDGSIIGSTDYGSYTKWPNGRLECVISDSTLLPIEPTESLIIESTDGRFLLFGKYK